MAEYLPYPKPVESTSGCKVGWKVYDNRADAEACSAAAEANAAVRASYGYDFGYCWPGEIKERADGMFVVTVP